MMIDEISTSSPVSADTDVWLAAIVARQRDAQQALVRQGRLRQLFGRSRASRARVTCIATNLASIDVTFGRGAGDLVLARARIAHECDGCLDVELAVFQLSQIAIAGGQSALDRLCSCSDVELVERLRQGVFAA